MTSTRNDSPSVYISYRRDDAYLAGRLYDRLAFAAGDARVFMDIGSISPGEDWSDSISRAIASADVVLVIIGPRWLDSRDQTGERRLFDPDDPVRIEIAFALARGIRVIPLLFDDATMPRSDELPEDIRTLTRRNAIGISHERFSRDVERLLDVIRRVVLPNAASAEDKVALEPRARLTAVGEELRAITVEFFSSSGRAVSDTLDRRLLGPEPILIVDSTVLSEQDITEIGNVAREHSRLYLVHPERLTDDANHGLDKLRAHGAAIIPLSGKAMEAAMADGRPRVVLRELELEYGTDRNLFETKNSVIDERFLFGRSELLTRLGGSIASTESVLLTGLRKAGKTSVLNILRQHLIDYPVCHIDLQRFDRGDARWPQLLFQVILAAYDRWGRAHYPVWSFRAPYDGDVFIEMERRREYQAQHGRLPPFVLLLDELERVLPLSGEVEAAVHYARASGQVRALAQSYPGWIVVIGADLRPLANRINMLPSGETNPMFQFFSEVSLRLLEASAVDEMIRTLCQAMGVWHVDRRLSSSIFALSGGHPALVRMLAGASFRVRKDPQRLRSSDLSDGLGALRESNLLGSFFAENFWGPMTEWERQVILGASRARRSWTSLWRSITPPPQGEHEAEARAALASQGILRGEQVAVGAFANWVRARTLELR